MNNLIQVKKIKKTFPLLEKPLFNDVSFTMQESSNIAISGVSGSGKSTFLQILAGLESFDSGSVLLLGSKLEKISEKKINIIHRKSIGFIYQFHHLLSDFTALENIMIPLLLNDINYHAAQSASLKMLKNVGLAARANHYPRELSGGERQRVAIARAVIHTPKIIFADEPTGSLDKKNSSLILNLLLELVQEFNISLIVATHNLEHIKRFQSSYEMIDGQLKKC